MKSFRKLSHHIFVCLNQRPEGHPRGCCQSKGSEALLQAFKEEVAKRGLAAEVRAQKAGCLDVCEAGPAVVIYPEGTWYGTVRVEDVPEIVESHLVKKQPLERLLIPGRN
jgi:(2Fe-2S) ferredoxin